MIRKAPPIAPAPDLTATGTPQRPTFSPVIDDNEQVTITDMDFVFVGPMTFSVALDPLDTLTDQYGDGSQFRITFHKSGEAVDINKGNLLYTSTRPRLITRKKAPAVS